MQNKDRETISDLLEKYSFAIISLENPNATKLTNKENKK